MPQTVRECPFCERTPADPAKHISAFHRDRLRAMAEYQRVLAAGGSEQEARQAYNATLMPARPGTYDRTSFRSTP